MELIDTHLHLYAEEFNIDRDEVISRARALGVKKFLLPNIDSSSIASMLELEKNFPGTCYAMMGLHPCSVKENYKEELALVEQHLSARKFIAIGEMGIDLYWDKTFLSEQKEAFTRQVELANHYKIPVVIHTRESFDVTYDLLKKVRKEEPCGVFHCFSGTAEQAKMVTDLGFMLGIGGVVTFKNGGLDRVIPGTEMKHIILETDAPYLAPVPFRGKRNEPSYLLKVAEKISELKNVSVNEVAEITTANARKLFNI